MNQVSFSFVCKRFEQWTDGAVSTGELAEQVLVHMGTECDSKLHFWMIKVAFWLINHSEKRWV